jgi:hypothetical protein
MKFLPSFVRSTFPLLVIAALTGACATESSDEDSATSEGAIGRKSGCDDRRGHLELRPLLNSEFQVRYCVDGCTSFGTFNEQSFESPTAEACKVPRIATYLPKIVASWKSRNDVRIRTLLAPEMDPKTCSDAMELRDCLSTLPDPSREREERERARAREGS